MNDNPLLDGSGLPRFADVQPSHIASAMAQLIGQARAVVAQVGESEASDWEQVVVPLERALEQLGVAWGLVGHLIHVNGNMPGLREAYDAQLPDISAFYSELGQDLRLYARYRAIADSPDYEALSAERKKCLQNSLRDFRRAGADLDAAGKQRYAEIASRLAELSNRFSYNITDATDQYVRYFDSAEVLRGVPDDILAMYAAAAEAEGQRGQYKVNLQAPFLMPLLQYAEDRSLREAFYEANAKRASEFGPKEQDNTPLIREILTLRKEKAQLLGFANYAEYSLETKMAESPAQVEQFLRDLGARAKPFAEEDMRRLREFAASELGIDDLQPWDVAFASERLRQQRYAFSEQEVKQYFPQTRVMQGLFALVKKMFGIEFRPARAQLCHESAQFYELYRGEEKIGSVYADMYARDGKRPGAWMDSARDRHQSADALQLPVAHLVCNFTPAVGGKPSYLTHGEVLTLFHELGHCLHHLLTRVNESGVSGINGVEWDAVELPSQFMENFCWEWDVLQQMSEHAQTGAPLPRDLFERMLAARNFQSGMMTVRQVEFSLFDLRLFSHPQPAEVDWLALLEEVRREVAVVHPPAYHRFPNSFAHIFAGGYAAGYYSYKWAEVLSADCYAAFEEVGGADTGMGQRFWEEILSVGGSRPALASFRAFRGRDPDVTPLLRHLGLVDEQAQPA